MSIYYFLLLSQYNGSVTESIKPNQLTEKICC